MVKPPAGLEITEYPVIGLPPLETGAVKLTVACVLPGTALTPVGAAGTVGAVGVTATEGADGKLVPIAVVAVTVNV